MVNLGALSPAAPLTIHIMGQHGSGKTLLLRLIGAHLESLGFEVDGYDGVGPEKTFGKYRRAFGKTSDVLKDVGNLQPAAVDIYTEQWLVGRTAKTEIHAKLDPARKESGQTKIERETLNKIMAGYLQDRGLCADFLDYLVSHHHLCNEDRNDEHRSS